MAAIQLDHAGMSKKEEHQKKLLTRVRRVEGQLRGIQGMIEGGAECEALAQQMAAARKALDRAFFEMVACSAEMEIAKAPDLKSARHALGGLTQLLSKYG